MNQAVLPPDEGQPPLASRGLPVADPPAEERFDRVARLAQRLFQVPIVLISALEAGRHCLTSCLGLPRSELDCDISFCAQAGRIPDLLEIADAATDERFAADPLVAGPPGIRFYAGQPLRAPDGSRTGTLSLMDSRPRQLTAEERHLLRDLAALVEDELNLDQLAARQRAEEELRRTTTLQRAILDSANYMIVSTDADGIIRTFNRAAQDWLGYRAEELIGRATPVLLHDPQEMARRARELTVELGVLVPSGFEVFVTRPRRGIPDEHEWSFIRKDGTCLRVLLSVTALRDEAGTVTGFLGIGSDITARKQAEQALRQSEARFRTVNDATPLGVFLTTPSGGCIYTNRAFQRISGLSPEEARGKGWINVIHPADCARVLADWERTVRLGSSYESQHRFLLRSGVTVWTSVRAAAIRHEGHLLGFVGLVEDITDRKRAEEALRERESTLRSFYDSAAMMMGVVEVLNGDILHISANTEAARFFGRSPEAMRLQRASQLGTPAQCLTLWLENFRASERTGRPVRFEYVHETAEGPRWLSATVCPIAEKGRAGIRFSYVAEDITDRKRDEAALAERVQLAALTADVSVALTREDTLRGILQRCTEALVKHLDAAFARIWTLNAADNVLELQASAGLYTHLDGPHSRVPVGQLKIGRIAQERQPHLTNAVVGDPRVSDQDWARREGMVAFAGHPLTLGEQLVGVMALFARHPLSETVLNALATAADGIAVGIERKRAETELKRAKEAAEQASRAKSDFLAKMSHELRTPLNSVIGFANIMLKNKPKNLLGQDLAYLGRILDNGKHLLSLMNNILDLSKIEAGRMELEIAAVALEALVHETLAHFEAQARDRPVRLIAELPAALAPIEADPSKLKQILLNLIGNALKFTERGSVTVRIDADPRTSVPLRLDVVDTGIGVPADRQQAIFEAFQQADNTTTRKFGGTGLGLTISRSLCQLMGYRLAVSSEAGKGSTFSILLAPAATAPARSEIVPAWPGAVSVLPASTGEVPDLKGRTVLVIDDQADARLLLTQYLEDFGCRVLAAAAGEQGLQLARAHATDLIMLDLMMPPLNGWEVLKALKADPQLQDIPVVIVSIVAIESRGVIVGAVDFLNKPLVRADLARVLRRHLLPGDRKVLVVEDDPDTPALIAAYVTENGGETRTAANGQEALHVLRVFVPDVIFLDLVMPVMDGLTFLEALRQDPRHRDLPVVVVTAQDLTPEQAQRLARETAAVLRKGEDLEQALKATLRHTVRRQSRPSSASVL